MGNDGEMLSLTTLVKDDGGGSSTEVGALRRSSVGAAASYFASKRMDPIGAGDETRLETQLLDGQNVDAEMGTKAHCIVNIPSYSRRSCNT